MSGKADLEVSRCDRFIMFYLLFKLCYRQNQDGVRPLGPRVCREGVITLSW